MISKEDRDILLQFASALTNEDEAHGEAGKRYVKVPLTVAKAVAFSLQCIVLKDLTDWKSDLDAFLRQHETRPAVQEAHVETRG